MERRTYKIDPIIINEEIYSEVIIDPHYELKHSEHINDELILSLVALLDGSENLPEEVKGSFNYFVKILVFKSRAYRLVWLLEEGKLYIGVVNVFRDRGEMR